MAAVSYCRKEWASSRGSVIRYERARMPARITRMRSAPALLETGGKMRTWNCSGFPAMPLLFSAAAELVSFSWPADLPQAENRSYQTKPSSSHFYAAPHLSRERRNPPGSLGWQQGVWGRVYQKARGSAGIAAFGTEPS